MREIWAVMRAEWGLLPVRLGGAAGLAWVGVLGALLGGYIPWRLGFEFLDAGTLILYAFLSCWLAAPLVARSMGVEQEAKLLEATPARIPKRAALYGKVLAAASAGWAGALLILTAGLATMSIRLGSLLIPGAAVLLSVVSLSLAGAVFTAAAGARVALREPSARAAWRTMRWRLLALLVVYFLATRLLPGGWKEFFDGQMIPSRLARNAVILSAGLLVATAVLLRATGSRRR